jgi:hypothetical protein
VNFVEEDKLLHIVDIVPDSSQFLYDISQFIISIIFRIHEENIKFLNIIHVRNANIHYDRLSSKR